MEFQSLRQETPQGVFYAFLNKKEKINENIKQLY